VVWVFQELLSDGFVLGEASLGIGLGFEQQRPASFRAEVPPEEQPQQQPVARRHWLDGLRKELLQPRRPGGGDHERRRAGAVRALPPHIALALELGQRGVDLAEALAPEVAEYVPDRLADRVAGHRHDAESPEYRGLRLTRFSHRLTRSLRLNVSARYIYQIASGC
jgi:hypothetical protein